MVNSWRRCFSFALNFCPDEWRFLYVENPAVVDAFLSDVSSEYDEVRLGERKSMAVSFSGSFMGYINDVPDSDSITDVKMIQVIGGEAS
jgi:hypothetical protein